MASAIISDFESVLKGSLSELPGMLLMHAKDLCQDVFIELCNKSWIWQEKLSLTLVDGTLLYDLIGAQGNTLVIGALTVLDELGEKLVKDSDYWITADNQFELLNDSITGVLAVNCIIQPTPDYSGIPEDLRNKYTSQLSIGVKSRAMLEMNQTWSSPQSGTNYKNQWERLLLTIRSDVKEGFSVTRHGRPHSPRSFYF